MAQLKEFKSGERLSFFSLFAEKGLIIEIPIIQRDYAQGRISSLNIRERFLDAIAAYLKENSPGRDLDFIYGSIAELEAGHIFIPLDGQQRLTTLFLLHWYLALVSGEIRDFRQYLGHQNRSCFTYETRASAREFCDALVLKDFDYHGPVEGQNISKRIRDTHWYYLSWDFDPTIQSMLVMLDSVEMKFHKHPEYYKRLANLEDPIITFQFLNLKEFNLTDDLYIKMNSRGKVLTPFENFKAKFEQEIKRLFEKEKKVFELATNGTIREVSAYEYFSNRIDTFWLDFFWKTGGNDPKLVDIHIMNFIRVVFANHLAIRGYDQIIWEAIQRPYNFRVLIDSQDVRKKRNTENLSYFDFLELGAISKDSIHYLIKALDELTGIDSSSVQRSINSFHYDYNFILKKVFTNSLTAQERVKFHAFISCLFQDNEQYDTHPQWMRVIHNLVENTRLDDTDVLISSLQSTNQIAVHSDNILQWLSSKKSVVGSFYSRQVEEEKIKARLILRGDHWEELIYSLEHSSFFNGQIGFLLEFSGIIDEYLRPGSFDWDTEEDQEYYAKFSDYSKKASAIFDEIGGPNNQDYLWERAVLSKGNYLLPASYNRLNFLHTSINTRDYSWKRLLRLNRESDNDNSELSKKRSLVKEVFDDPRFDANDAWGSCAEIVQDGAEDWRNYFIKNPDLIKVCGHGFIRHESDLSIRLQTKTKLTYHYELRTLNLFKRSIEGKIFAPFEASEYWWAYGDSDELCSIYFGSWTHQRKKYQLNIYFESDYGYGIGFSKMKGQLKESEYSDEITDILKGQGFKFDLETWEGFYSTSKNERGIMKKLNDLCVALNDLNK